MADTDGHKFSSKAKEYTFIGKSFNGFDKDGNRKEFKGGDKVTLEPEQFEAFKDQFEEPKSEAPKVEPKVAPKSEPSKVEPSKT